MQDVEGSTPTGGTGANDFSNPIDQDVRIPPGVCGHDSVPLSNSENVITRIGLHTYLNCQITVYLLLFPEKRL